MVVGSVVVGAAHIPSDGLPQIITLSNAVSGSRKSKR